MIHLSFQFVYGIMKQSETVEKLIYGNRTPFRVQFLSAPNVRRKIWENIFSAFKLTKDAEAEGYFLPKHKKAHAFLRYLDAESVDLQNFLRTLADWEAVSFRSV